MQIYSQRLEINSYLVLNSPCMVYRHKLISLPLVHFIEIDTSHIIVTYLLAWHDELFEWSKLLVLTWFDKRWKLINCTTLYLSWKKKYGWKNYEELFTTFKLERKDPKFTSFNIWCFNCIFLLVVLKILDRNYGIKFFIMIVITTTSVWIHWAFPFFSRFKMNRMILLFFALTFYTVSMAE